MSSERNKLKVTATHRKQSCMLDSKWGHQNSPFVCMKMLKCWSPRREKN